MIKRYTLPEMGNIWEDEFKFSTWLKIEILACEARAEMGEIPTEDVKIIKEKAKEENLKEKVSKYIKEKNNNLYYKRYYSSIINENPSIYELIKAFIPFIFENRHKFITWLLSLEGVEEIDVITLWLGDD